MFLLQLGNRRGKKQETVVGHVLERFVLKVATVLGKSASMLVEC